MNEEHSKCFHQDVEAMDEREQGCCREGLCMDLSEVRQVAKAFQYSLFNLVLELVSHSSSGLFCLLHFDKIL